MIANGRLQEHASVETHVRNLGQKYMGIRPQTYVDEVFRDTSVHNQKGGHLVPISNFLNAQCKPSPTLGSSFIR